MLFRSASACEPVDALVQVEPSVAKVMPPLSPPAQRLSKWLGGGEEFQSVRVAIAKRVLRELTGPRRLRPTDAEGEIEVMRALAMALTAAAPALLPLEDVQETFVTRSRTLVTGDFVSAYLGSNRSAREECESLLWLVENVIGAANKRQAGRYLAAAVAALRFEKELRFGGDSPSAKLAGLAQLQKSVASSGLAAEDFAPIQAKIGEIGALVEADSKIVTQLGRSQTSAIQRVLLLLQMAVGDSAPTGGVAERARAEALRLMRADETRAEMAKAPERVGRIRDLIQQLSQAA